MIKGENREWQSHQIQHIRDWVNENLPPNAQKVHDIAKDCADGTTLLLLLNRITQTEISGVIKSPTTKIQRINNVTLALQYIHSSLKVALPTVGPEDIVEGNLKLILGTLWALIRHLSHNDATSRKTERLVQNPKANLDHDDPRRHRATSSLSTQSEVYVPQPVQPSTITEPLEEKHHESVVSETNLNAEKKGSEIEENEVVEVSEQKEDKVEDDFTNSESETDDNSPKEINETIDEVSNAKEDSVTDANDEDSEFPVVIGFEVKEETVEAEARERAASLALSLDRQEQERKRREAEEAAIIEEKRRAREEQEKREREAEENMIAQKMEEVKEQKKQLVTEEIEKEEQKVPEEIKSEETFSHEERSEDVETETPSKSSNMPDSWPKESSSLKGSEIEANEGKEESKAELDNKKAEYDRLKRERSRTKSLSASSSRRPKKPSDHPAMILDSFGARSRNSSAPVVVTNRVTKPEYVIPYSPSLIYVDPKSKQKEFYRLCSETTNIGRKDDNDLPLVSQYVSRYHARIDCEQLNGETAIVFKDLNSYSGSRVNGEKLNQKVLLKGDQIKIGKTLLVFTDKSDKPLLSDVTKEGPGFKQSSKLLKPWQSRYFVYQGQVIFYFKSKKERQANVPPDGMLDLEGCIIEREDKNSFSLIVNKRQISLKFDKDKEEWLDICKSKAMIKA